MSKEILPNAEEPLRHGGMEGRREILLETTRQALVDGDYTVLRLVLNSQHPADLAALFSHLEEKQQQNTLPLLAEGIAAATLAEMDTATRMDVTEDLGEEELSGLVGEMEPDDAADLLGELSDEQSSKVLELLQDDAEEVRLLLEHPEDTGGGIMTPRLVSVSEQMTVADAIERLREQEDEADDNVYLYVTDALASLVGTVSLRSLLLAQPQTPISTLTRPNPIAVGSDMDQEEIAQVISTYNLMAVPVVDASGRLVGQVTIDDVVDIIEQEATEDIYSQAATSSEELEERSVFGVVRRRLPWLLVCLAGTLLSGGIIDYFDGMLAATGLLLLFVPAIMAMGGNTGIQTSTVTVRSIATGKLGAEDVLKTVSRELRTALCMGSLLGLLVFGVARMWVGSLALAYCVGLAMFAAIVLSAVLGALIPLLFRALNVDPAVASGPLITTINDAIALLIYFSVALALLGDTVNRG
jgi:magnesium transporter